MADDDRRTVATLLGRAREIRREQGAGALLSRTRGFLLRALRRAWDRRVRPRLPARTVAYNGVTVAGTGTRLGDAALPWYTADRPRYEDALVDAVREHVFPGDDVVVVGGGWGVSAVVAAAQTGPDGSVTVFEAGAESVARVRDTVARNGVGDRVTVRHAVVGPVVDVEGDADDAERFPPADIPDCDALVLDCEGAELAILDDLDAAPARVVVESHGLFDSPTDRVAAELSAGGYDVVSRAVAETERLRTVAGDGVVRTTDLRAHCEAEDVCVLVGVAEANGAGADGGADAPGTDAAGWDG